LKSPSFKKFCYIRTKHKQTEQPIRPIRWLRQAGFALLLLAIIIGTIVGITRDVHADNIKRNLGGLYLAKLNAVFCNVGISRIVNITIFSFGKEIKMHFASFPIVHLFSGKCTISTSYCLFRTHNTGEFIRKSCVLGSEGIAFSPITVDTGNLYAHRIRWCIARVFPLSDKVIFGRSGHMFPICLFNKNESAIGGTLRLVRFFQSIILEKQNNGSYQSNKNEGFGPSSKRMSIFDNFRICYLRYFLAIFFFIIGYYATVGLSTAVFFGSSEKNGGLSLGSFGPWQYFLLSLACG
jgi:hypothetical protein